MRMRGPGISPRSTASLKPCGEPDASRTEVNPASSVTRAFSAASNAASVGGVSARCCIEPQELQKWTCESIRPGSTVFPATSITSASGGR